MTRLFTLLCLAACAADDPCADACAALGDTEVDVAIRVGEGPGEDVADGTTIPFVQGPQGGWHVFGAARVSGLLADGTTGQITDPCLPTWDFDVSGPVTDASPAFPRPATGPVAGAYQLPGQIVVLDIADPDEADGADVTLSVTVSDACGRSGSDAVDVTLSFATPGADDTGP